MVLDFTTICKASHSCPLNSIGMVVRPLAPTYTPEIVRLRMILPVSTFDTVSSATRPFSNVSTGAVNNIFTSSEWKLLAPKSCPSAKGLKFRAPKPFMSVTSLVNSPVPSRKR